MVRLFGCFKGIGELFLFSWERKAHEYQTTSTGVEASQPLTVPSVPLGGHADHVESWFSVTRVLLQGGFQAHHAQWLEVTTHPQESGTCSELHTKSTHIPGWTKNDTATWRPTTIRQCQLPSPPHLPQLSVWAKLYLPLCWGALLPSGLQEKVGVIRADVCARGVFSRHCL